MLFLVALFIRARKNFCDAKDGEIYDAEIFNNSPANPMSAPFPEDPTLDAPCTFMARHELQSLEAILSILIAEMPKIKPS
jgi:hypothetical protein